MKELREIRILFAPDGTTEISVTYSHPDPVANPATKKRIAADVRMVRAGLLDALAGLEAPGVPTWGGFATDTKVSTDTVIVEREENAA
jgi:hypothetical protein